MWIPNRVMFPSCKLLISVIVSIQRDRDLVPPLWFTYAIMYLLSLDIRICRWRFSWILNRDSLTALIIAVLSSHHPNLWENLWENDIAVWDRPRNSSFKDFSESEEGTEGTCWTTTLGRAMLDHNKGMVVLDPGTEMIVKVGWGHLSMKTLIWSKDGRHLLSLGSHLVSSMNLSW